MHCIKLTVCSLALFSQPAWAEAQQADSAQSEPAAGATAVEDIVVTAQRKSERLQDVPITVTAVTAAALDRAGAVGTADLPNLVPNLLLSKASTAIQPFLRGVGTQAVNPGNDPSIAVYVDGVYNSAPTGLLFSFNNIERIEVLKGPQGTLFGRNATGGLIHIITKDPTARPQARLEVGYGRFNTFNGSAYVSGGTDTVAADLSLLYNRQADGWGHNLFKPGDAGPVIVNGVQIADPPVTDKAGTRKEWSARSKLILSPSDRAKIKFTASYIYSNSDQGLYRHPIDGAVLSANGVTPFVHDGGFWDYHSDAAWAARVRQILIANESSYEADFATFKSITSYLHARTRSIIPSDDTPQIGAATSDARLGYDTFTQELQMLSGKDTGLSWLDYIVGAFYLHSKGIYNLDFVRGNFLEPTTRRSSAQTTDSLAGYGQLTAHITDSTRITAGLRYTVDKIVGEQYVLGISPFATSGASKLGQVSQLVDPRSKAFRKLTWRFVVDQKLSPGIMLFGGVSRGYKAGAWNHGGLCLDTPPLGSACQRIQAPVKPEILDDYEAGIKSELFDRRLRLNASAFRYNYSNLQLQQSVGIPPISVLTNAAKARINGFELEGTGALTPNININFAYSYLDAKYKSFPNAVVFVQRAGPPYNDLQTTIDATGKQMIRAPKHTFNVGVDMNFPVDFGELGLSANLSHNGGFAWEASNRVRESAYNVLNAQLSVKRGNFTVRVRGRNLTNEKYYTFVQTSSSGDQGAPAAPLTYDVSLIWQL